MIEPTEDDIGRGVVYTGNRYPGGKKCLKRMRRRFSMSANGRGSCSSRRVGGSAGTSHLFRPAIVMLGSDAAGRTNCLRHTEREDPHVRRD